MARPIYTKRNYEIDVGPLIEEETKNGTEWNNKQEKVQQDFLWALGPNATHEITRFGYRTDPDNFKKDEKQSIYTTDLTNRKGTNTTDEIFLGQTNRYRNTERPLGQNKRIGRRKRFSTI